MTCLILPAGWAYLRFTSCKRYPRTQGSGQDRMPGSQLAAAQCSSRLGSRNYKQSAYRSQDPTDGLGSTDSGRLQQSLKISMAGIVQRHRIIAFQQSCVARVFQKVLQGNVLASFASEGTQTVESAQVRDSELPQACRPSSWRCVSVIGSTTWYYNHIQAAKHGPKLTVERRLAILEPAWSSLLFIF
ncbi:hypothetical protein N657DRAFT_109474 [Parathielavia appendiculata]|uniref:Uncharacterized protein n=1 Tax=Parathielavia appendiculata TaxID=2587402 RepID=A0AAN6Z103_9PEZI|nr:hypothetical protein N657DRAFT_109474 [Parathielavia appendiculata]